MFLGQSSSFTLTLAAVSDGLPVRAFAIRAISLVPAYNLETLPTSHARAEPILGAKQGINLKGGNDCLKHTETRDNPGWLSILPLHPKRKRPTQ
jgi:hypothetical protein